MDLLTFHLGDREFAVDLHRVVEIISPPPITRVPDMPPVVRGLIGLRGEPTAVLDGGVRLTGRRVELTARSPIVILSASQDDRELRYGILVDAAGRKASVETLLPWSASQENVTDDDACVGFAEVDGALVLVLDVDELLELRSARAVDDSPSTGPAIPSPSSLPHSSPAASSPAASSPAVEPAVRARPAPPTTAAAARGSTIVVAARVAAAHAATMPAAATRPRAAPTVTSPSREPTPGIPFAAPRFAPEPIPSRSDPHPPSPSPPAMAMAMAAAAATEREKRGVPLIGWIAGVVAILLAIALLLLTRERPDGREAVASRSARPNAREAAPEPSRAPPGSVSSPEAPVPSPNAPKRATPPPIADPLGSTPPKPIPEVVTSPPPAPAPEPPPARTRRPLPPSMVVRPDTPACEVHEVVKGDTLWWISARKLGDPYRWPELFGENRERLRDPDVIEVHDRIRIPGACDPHP